LKRLEKNQKSLSLRATKARKRFLDFSRLTYVEFEVMKYKDRYNDIPTVEKYSGIGVAFKGWTYVLSDFHALRSII